MVIGPDAKLLQPPAPRSVEWVSGLSLSNSSDGSLSLSQKPGLSLHHSGCQKGFPHIELELLLLLVAPYWNLWAGICCLCGFTSPHVWSSRNRTVSSAGEADGNKNSYMWIVRMENAVLPLSSKIYMHLLFDSYNPTVRKKKKWYRIRLKLN